MTKQETLKQIQDEWARLLSVLSTFDDDQKLQPRFVGEWSLKDLMGHISAWESVALERLGRVKRGEEVEFIPDDQIDDWNKRFVQMRRDWKLVVVEGEFESVHARLVQEFERLPEELWDRNVSKICAWLPECTFVHYAEHRARLESKFATTQQGVTS
ncbi:MAG TPA: DinB family protein [Bacteroidota bacterium]|nr:DinB family protein [Bacteroidota bacterium]